jgi:hypothetical protein
MDKKGNYDDKSLKLLLVNLLENFLSKNASKVKGSAKESKFS